MLQVWKGCAELRETGGVCYWGLSGLLSFVGGMYFYFFFFFIGSHRSKNAGMVWGRRNLKDHLVSIPLLWAVTPSTRPGCFFLIKS